eukprot:4384620-Amphidinium_carterae.1
MAVPSSLFMPLTLLLLESLHYQERRKTHLSTLHDSWSGVWDFTVCHSQSCKVETNVNEV